MVQEFFGSRDTMEGLASKLIDSGFQPDPYAFRSLTIFEAAPALLDPVRHCRSYRLEDVFVNIQSIASATHVARTNPVSWCFVLQFGHPLNEYGYHHPLRTFFRALDQPQAYGISGLEPKYPVDQYVR